MTAREFRRKSVVFLVFGIKLASLDVGLSRRARKVLLFEQAGRPVRSVASCYIYYRMLGADRNASLKKNDDSPGAVPKCIDGCKNLPDLVLLFVCQFPAFLDQPSHPDNLKPLVLGQGP